MASVRENADWYLLSVVLAAGLLTSTFSHTETSPAAYLTGAAGLIAVQARLRSEFSPGSALAATVLIFAATSLFWSMTHASRSREALAFGLVAALVMVTARLTSGRLLFWVLVAAAPLGVRVLAGAPAAAHAEADLASPLFSASRGFLSLAPVAYLAALGTLAYARRNPFPAIAAILVFAAWIAVATFNPAPADGPAGHGLTAALAVLAPGLAFLVERARARPMLAVAPLVVAGLLWNYWLMVQFTIGTLPKDAPVSFAAMVRQQADVHTRGPYTYPFAFPANAWFGWREGVPAARYDLLASEPRRESIDLALDESADRFLLEGWDAPGPDSAGPVHWIRRAPRDDCAAVAPAGGSAGARGRDGTRPPRGAGRRRRSRPRGQRLRGWPLHGACHRGRRSRRHRAGRRRWTESSCGLQSAHLGEPRRASRRPL